MPLVTNRSYANEYVSKNTFTATGEDVGFGFVVSMLRLRNDAALSVYFTLRSSTGATTNDAELKSSEELIVRDVPVSGMSYVASSSGGSLRIQAWGDLS